MFKFKKIVALLLCLVMISSIILTSCGNGNNTPADTSDESKTESTENNGSTDGHESTGQHTHTPASAVTENLVDSTCTQTGSYDEVVHCSVCNEEISRTPKTIEKKSHEYNQKVTTNTYLQSEATCTESAVYFYSCACGEKSDDTFTDGNANGHSYASDWEKDAIHHWHKANCEHTGEISGKIEHDFGTDNICDTCEYVRGIAVSGITLNYTSFAAMVGDVKTLIATVTPDDATNKKVMWTTSNSAVISVDDNGVVTAISAGNAIVYAVTEDGAKMAQCIVVVIDNECSHATTRTERENEIDSTCKDAGSYDEVVYCSACGDELSRTQNEIAKKETHTPVTDPRVEPTFTETGLTEGSHCGVCGFVIVVQDVIPVKPSKSDLLSEKLTVNETSISGKVSYATTEFNFATDISVTNNGTWVLSTDINGVHTIITKTAPLSEGNNVLYIHVENPDKSVTTYTVNIYRNHMYTVSFDTDGGTSVEPQYVEEGYLAIAPSTNKSGYTFASWNYDFNTPITSNITIKANWNANTGTAYRVEYYLENVNKNGYDIVSAETENLTGTTDTTANAEQKTFTHFTLNTSKSILSGNINGDGSLVLKVYYTRNTYTVSTSRNNTKGGTVTSGGTHAYDTEITLTATTNVGYTFLGWFEGETKVCDSLTYTLKVDHTAIYTAKWSANTDTAYTVEYYLENANKNGYDIIASETENLTSATDTTANAEQKTFPHFTLDNSKSILSGNINGDGSLVLRVYYTRNTYNVSTNRNNTKGGTVTSGGTYAYDTEITLTATTNVGYTFLGWFEGETKVCDSLTYTLKVDHTAIYTAKWSANTDTAYTVEYYLENANKNGYDIIASETENLTSTTDTTANAEQKTFTHFTLNTSKSILSGNINGDGSLVLKVYYTRNTYSVNSDDTSIGTVSNGGSYGYNKQITVSASVSKLGYTFVGWYSGEDLLSSDPEYTFNIDKNVVAKFDVAAEMKNFNFTSTSTTCTITGIKDKMITEIAIPDCVTSIGYKAFGNCTSLKNVIISDSITSIGQYAFSSCSSLESITLGTGIKSIGYNAFSGCAITKVYISDFVAWCNINFDYSYSNAGNPLNRSDALLYLNGESFKGEFTIPYGVEKIPRYTFQNSAITSVVITDTVNTIDAGSFKSCTSLSNIVIGNGVTNIGYGAFMNCQSLVDISIPQMVTSIDEGAFNKCTSLTNVYITDIARWCNIMFADDDAQPLKYAKNLYLDGKLATNIVLPDTVKEISKYAFYNCTTLLSIEIPNSVTNIDYSAFSGCTNLTSITIPNTLSQIQAYAFYNCTSLTSIEFSDNITNIGSYAFYNCTNLREITMSKSITEIGHLAFYNCTSITEVYYLGDVENWLGITFLNETSNPTLYANNVYFNGVLVTELSIPNTVTQISNFAFSNFNSLKHITIPSSVTYIGERAFYKCTSLVNIDIPDSVTFIGEQAFSTCRSLTSITIPKLVTTLGDYMFSNCTGLTQITIGNNVTNIGHWAFYNCTALRRVYYLGASTEWNNISIDSDANSCLTSATRYYYSENQPTDNTRRYWRYVDGVPTPWEDN